MRAVSLLTVISYVMCWMPQPLISTNVTLVKGETNGLNVEVEGDANFLDIIEHVQPYFTDDLSIENNEMLQKSISVGKGESAVDEFIHLNFTLSYAGFTPRGKKNEVNRSYEAGYSKENKKDIAYIVNTLATESKGSLLFSRSSLDEAGSRIKHLHPFCFLSCIFTDEKLKCGAHAIKERGGMIKNGFYEGITESLKEEHQRQNVLQYAHDFARVVKIDANLIMPVLQNSQWEEFVNILIANIPRQIDHARYNQ